MCKMHVKVDVSGPMRRIKKMYHLSSAGSVRDVMNSFHAYMAGEIDNQFRVAGSGSSGGTARGQRWEPFKDQYTRKTDGMVVPAWGGVPKLRKAKIGGRWIGADIRTREPLKRGHLVLGKKRPSGKRITRSSRLMQDTGRMRGEAVRLVKHWTNGRLSRMTMYCKVGYAVKQNAMRPFYYFTEADRTYALREFHRHVVGADTLIRPARGGVASGRFFSGPSRGGGRR